MRKTRRVVTDPPLGADDGARRAQAIDTFRLARSAVNDEFQSMIAITAIGRRDLAWSLRSAEAFDNLTWLGREGSNLRMAESKSAALPLGYAPTRAGP